MFEKYTKKTFDLLKKQHNILVLVGNGFDVALLKKHNVGKMKGKTSSYIDFYEYIRYYNFSDENNILFKQMTRDREEHRNDWSDFELTIKRLVERPDISVSEIERCVDEFQTYFTRFLNDLVDADVLLEINKDSKDKKLAIQSFERFLRDLPDNSSLEFPSKTGHYDLYNFMFFNFNYTALLDNYIYLDKTYSDACNILSNNDLSYNLVLDNGIYVMEQDPVAGTIVKRNSRVELVTEPIGNNAEVKRIWEESLDVSYGNIAVTFKDTNIILEDSGKTVQCYGNVLEDYTVKKAYLLEETVGVEYHDYILDDSVMIFKNIPQGIPFKLIVLLEGYEEASTEVTISSQNMEGGTYHFTWAMMSDHTETLLPTIFYVADSKYKIPQC